MDYKFLIEKGEPIDLKHTKQGDMFMTKYGLNMYLQHGCLKVHEVYTFRQKGIFIKRYYINGIKYTRDGRCIDKRLSLRSPELDITCWVKTIQIKPEH